MTLWLDWLVSEHALTIANKPASAKESLAAAENATVRVTPLSWM
jgi:hypothetical protein